MTPVATHFNGRVHMLRRFVITFGVAIAVAGCVRRGPTLPEPAQVMEFVIPWEHAFPSDVIVDDRGRVWFTDRMAQVIGRFDPETRQFDRFDLPTAKSAPYGFVRGPDGAFWYAAAVAGRLGRVDPGTGEITEVELEGVSGGPHLLAVRASELWFTARGAQMYGRYEPATGRLEVYSAPERFRPYGIAVANGRVWIAEYAGATLLEVDAETEQARIHELSWPLPVDEGESPSMGDSSRPRRRPVRRFFVGARRMAAGADGVLWISGFGSGRVVSFDPGSGELDDHLSLTPSSPYGIVAASDGLVWYGDTGNDAVIALDPRTRERTTFRIPTPDAAVRHLAVDVERGRVWLPLSDAGRIGLIDLGARD